MYDGMYNISASYTYSMPLIVCSCKLNWVVVGRPADKANGTKLMGWYGMWR